MEQRSEIAPLVARVSEVISGRLESLAAEAGVSYHTLYAWGTGRRNVSSAQLGRLADAVERRSLVLAALAEELRETARTSTTEREVTS